MKYCTKCGNEIKDGNKFCTKCGAAVGEAEKPVEQAEAKEQTAAVNEQEEKVEEAPEQAAESTQPPANGIPAMAIPVTTYNPPPTAAAVNGAAVVPTVATATKKVDKDTKLVIIIVAVVLALIITGTAGGIGYSVYRKHKYLERASSFRFYIGLQAGSAESQVKLIQAVWNNSIREVRDDATDPYTIKTKYSNGYVVFYDDFNDALENLFNDEEFQNTNTLLSIFSERTYMTSDKYKLDKYPKSCEELYEAALRLAIATDKIKSFATDPKGSYNSYTSDWNDACDEYIEARDNFDYVYDRLKK